MQNQPLEEHAFYAGLTHYGRTALFIIIENGATDLPGWLIDAEAAISGHSAWENENTTDNVNVLQFAAMCGNTAAIDILLEYLPASIRANYLNSKFSAFMFGI